MKFSKIFVSLAVVVSVLFMISCSDDDGGSTEPTPTPPTILKVMVKSSTDSSAVENSNVVIYDAETKDAVIRALTNDDGAVHFELLEDDYYVELAAQNYDPSPAENVTPIPFFVMEEDTTEVVYYLNSNPVANSSFVRGIVEPSINNVLIQAVASSGTDKYATVSGPDGFFILYNLPDDNYTYEALKSGFKLDTVLVTNVVSTEAIYDSLTVQISQYAGSTLSGAVSFLATTDTLDVDIVLRDPITMAVIPGMLTRELTGNYDLTSIPDGDFVAWASFENDGYVIDPDWIFKNPDGLNLSFPTDDGITLDFSVTGSIKMFSPTNPMDSIYAFVADSLVPTFSWEAYPSTKEYIIEVRDLSGNVLWGGFQADGTVNHGYIDDSETSIIYDFDGTATQALVPGEIYQWKLWADKGTAVDSGVEQLISTTEDLRGIFTVPEAK